MTYVYARNFVVDALAPRICFRCFLVPCKCMWLLCTYVHVFQGIGFLLFAYFQNSCTLGSSKWVAPFNTYWCEYIDNNWFGYSRTSDASVRTWNSARRLRESCNYPVPALLCSLYAHEYYILYVVQILPYVVQVHVDVTSDVPRLFTCTCRLTKSLRGTWHVTKSQWTPKYV